MIVGHLPAGYLAACALERGFAHDRVLWWALVAGSIAPDFDMLWFLFVDHGAVHHHSYLTHDPAVWIALVLVGLTFGRRALIGLGLGGVLHLALDSIVGAVTWGYGDWSWQAPLIEVPATQSHWVLSFLLHWTFAIELVVCFAAVIVFWRRRGQV